VRALAGEQGSADSAPSPSLFSSPPSRSVARSLSQHLLYQLPPHLPPTPPVSFDRDVPSRRFLHPSEPSLSRTDRDQSAYCGARPATRPSVRAEDQRWSSVGPVRRYGRGMRSLWDGSCINALFCVSREWNAFAAPHVFKVSAASPAAALQRADLKFDRRLAPSDAERASFWSGSPTAIPRSSKSKKSSSATTKPTRKVHVSSLHRSLSSLHRSLSSPYLPPLTSPCRLSTPPRLRRRPQALPHR
jgi:hypothetical protein